MEEDFKILCDTKVPLKLEDFFHQTSIRPMMLYKTKYQTLKQHTNKVSVVKMKILCWMYDKTAKDRIVNENI